MNWPDYTRTVKKSLRSESDFIPDEDYNPRSPCEVLEAKEESPKQPTVGSAMGIFQEIGGHVVTLSVASIVSKQFVTGHKYAPCGKARVFYLEGEGIKSSRRNILILEYQRETSPGNILRLKPQNMIKFDQNFFCKKEESVAVRSLVATVEPAQARYENLLERYHELIDVKEARELSQEQETELQDIERQLDSHETVDLENLIRRDRAFDDSEEVRQLRELNRSIKELLDRTNR